MKLLIFSPLSTRSAIGRVTTVVVHSLLAQGHEVVVARTETPTHLQDSMLQCPAPVISWTDEAEIDSAAATADAVVYVVGNHFPFHEGALHWMGPLPGLVCLHDFVLVHLFETWAASHPSTARRALRNWYGADADEAFRQRTGTFLDDALEKWPLTEWLVSKALAVISHSHWGMDRVRRACPGPTRVVHLPHHSNQVARAGPTHSDGSKVQVLTIGHVNANKRIESVIRAIGSSPLLREHVAYRLCGFVTPRTALALDMLARESGVDLLISGEVDEAELQRALDAADISCCLRWPALEAASASTVEALLHGNAVIATDTGFYRDLPDECAIKISTSDEVHHIRLALERLVSDPAGRMAMAERGRRWAATMFTADHYARELVDVAGLMLRSRPAIDAARQFASVMREWGAAQELMTSPEICGPLQIFGQD